MSTERRTYRWRARLGVAALALAIPVAGRAQFGGGGLPDLSGVAGAISGTVAPKPAGVFSSGLKVPSVQPGATAKGIGRQLRTSVEEKTGQENAGLQALEDGMAKALVQMEDQLQKLGLAKRDFGVAVGYFFVTNYETATGKTVPQDASLAAGRTMAKAVGMKWGAKFNALPAEKKESMYEALIVTPMLLNALAEQFDKAGKSADAQSMRSAAGSTFKTLFGADPSAVTIDAKGMISGFPGGRAASTGGRTVSRRPERPGKPELPVGGLVPAKVGGAKVYVRYVVPDGFSGGGTFRELVLFPDGSAFEGLPSDPIPSFDAATIRRYSKKYDVGTWRQSGGRMTLVIDGGKPETWVKHPSGGWAETDYKSGAYGVYWPVKLATKAQLLGAWKHKSLSTMGMAGGGTPMVASGSNGDLSFAANGTFSRAREGFASATTANMGDAFKSGNVTTYGKNKSGAQGQWRLDGPVLTTVENGRRGVQLAYILPNWNKDGSPPELLIGGDWWYREGTHFKK